MLLVQKELGNQLFLFVKIYWEATNKLAPHIVIYV